MNERIVLIIFTYSSRGIFTPPPPRTRKYIVWDGRENSLYKNGRERNLYCLHRDERERMGWVEAISGAVEEYRTKKSTFKDHTLR